MLYVARRIFNVVLPVLTAFDEPNRTLYSAFCTLRWLSSANDSRKRSLVACACLRAIHVEIIKISKSQNHVLCILRHARTSSDDIIPASNHPSELGGTIWVHNPDLLFLHIWCISITRTKFHSCTHTTQTSGGNSTNQRTWRTRRMSRRIRRKTGSRWELPGFMHLHPIIVPSRQVTNHHATGPVRPTYIYFTSSEVSLSIWMGIWASPYPFASLGTRWRPTWTIFWHWNIDRELENWSSANKRSILGLQKTTSDVLPAYLIGKTRIKKALDMSVKSSWYSLDCFAWLQSRFCTRKYRTYLGSWTMATPHRSAGRGYKILSLWLLASRKDNP